MRARLTAAALAGFARVLTGLLSRWHGGGPRAEPTLYFANHTSHGDFVLLWSALPADLRASTRPVAAADYWQGGRLRRFIGLEVFRALLVDREAGSGRAAVQAMADALRAGDSLVLFPEGTRNTGEARLLPFRSGLFHLVRSCPEVRVVPVWIDNLRRVLPKGCWLPVPLACRVEFGAPLRMEPGEGCAEFLDRARAALLALPGDPVAEPRSEPPAAPAARTRIPALATVPTRPPGVLR